MSASSYVSDLYLGMFCLDNHFTLSCLTVAKVICEKTCASLCKKWNNPEKCSAAQWSHLLLDDPWGAQQESACMCPFSKVLRNTPICLRQTHPCPYPWHWLWYSWEHCHFHRPWQHLLPFAFLLRYITMCTTSLSCWRDTTLTLHRKQQAKPKKSRMGWDTLQSWGLSLFPMPLKEQPSFLPTSTHSGCLLTSSYLKVSVEQVTILGSIPKSPSSGHWFGNHPLAGTWCWAQALICDTDTFLHREIVKVCCRITSTHQQWYHRQKLSGGGKVGN